MKCLLLSVLLACASLGAAPLPSDPPAPVQPAAPETLTLRLTRAFDTAWDRGDHAALWAMMDPDIIYKTPFRTEIGREAVRDHVFKNAGIKFRDDFSTEDYSKIEDNLAYSTGTCTFNEYAADGTLKGKWTSRYLHIFTRRPGKDWKMRFHVVHEDAPPRKPAAEPAEKKPQ